MEQNVKNKNASILISTSVELNWNWNWGLNWLCKSVLNVGLKL